MKLNIKLDKKKIIIIASSFLALLLIIFLIIFLVKKNGTKSNNNTNVPKSFTPNFLTVAEKTKLGIPVDAKIEAITRDQKGEVTVYKVIKNDSDIVDPAQVKPISSRSLGR
jgi:predicted permease